MKPLIILKTGSAPTAVASEHGDFESWFCDYLAAPVPVQVINAVAGEALPDAEQLAGVLVTGSPAMVSHREDWSERAASWLVRIHQAQVPLLGVCYGHQLIAHALGGRVGPNPAGRHIGTARLQFTPAARGDALLGDVFLGGVFSGDSWQDGADAELLVQVTHQEHVQEPPPGAQILAQVALDPHHALRFGPSTWGLQFHPEFTAPVLRSYVALRRENIASEGLDPDQIHAAIVETPESTRILARFAALCLAYAERNPTDNSSLRAVS